MIRPGTADGVAMLEALRNGDRAAWYPMLDWLEERWPDIRFTSDREEECCNYCLGRARRRKGPSVKDPQAYLDAHDLEKLAYRVRLLRLNHLPFHRAALRFYSAFAKVRPEWIGPVSRVGPGIRPQLEALRVEKARAQRRVIQARELFDRLGLADTGLFVWWPDESAPDIISTPDVSVRMPTPTGGRKTRGLHWDAQPKMRHLLARAFPGYLAQAGSVFTSEWGDYPIVFWDVY